MGPKTFVLDSSALLTLIEEEPGASRVEEVLRKERTLLPWVVLMEVTYIARQEHGQPEADRRYALMRTLPSEILWQADEAIVLTAAAYKAEHRLSFADALIAAMARKADAILLHKDPEFEVLTERIALEALPYKPAI